MSTGYHLYCKQCSEDVWLTVGRGMAPGVMDCVAPFVSAHWEHTESVVLLYEEEVPEDSQGWGSATLWELKVKHGLISPKELSQMRRDLELAERNLGPAFQSEDAVVVVTEPGTYRIHAGSAVVCFGGPGDET